MSDRPLLLAFAGVVFAPLLLEAYRARKNERRQRARGGIEPGGDVYAWMQWAYPGLFLAMIGEGLWRGRLVGIASTGLVIFVLAKLLKWWAIVTLGEFWTFRVIVVPGSRAIRSGPYHFLRHPNYVAVVGEIVGVALFTGARISGPVALALFGALLLRRVSVENRALGAILPPN